MAGTLQVISPRHTIAKDSRTTPDTNWLIQHIYLRIACDFRFVGRHFQLKLIQRVGTDIGVHVTPQIGTMNVCSIALSDGEFRA